MARPYVIWDPSWNANLLTSSSGEPLIVSMDDNPTPLQVETYKKIVSLSSRPVLFGGPKLLYSHETNVVGGSDDKKGFQIINHPWMPNGLTYPGPGPDPFDLSDIVSGVQYRYVNLGWRFALRGWAGTMGSGKLTGGFRIKWADEITRVGFDSRAMWTGLTLGFKNTFADRIDHVLDVLHGKRETDPDWSYHCGWLDRVPSPGVEVIDEDTIALNDISSGDVRILISGGAPTWNVTSQYKTGSTWNDLGAYSIDFRSHLDPLELNEIGIIASAFYGVGLNAIPTPPVLPEYKIWFSELEVSQFEPWIPDRSSWSERGWDEHWVWLTGTTIGYDKEMRRPVTDLMHAPIGSDRSPLELRYSDPELGICVKMGAKSNLFATGISDNRYVEILPSAPPQPLVVCDSESYGQQAPFAFYMNGRFDFMETWVEDRAIVTFGNIFESLPTPTNNGIGLFWESTGQTSGKFIARIYAAGWVNVEYEIQDVSTISAKQISIGFAWTGSRGLSVGLNNYELRIVVNGVTTASQIISSPDIAATEIVKIGASGTTPGFQGLFRSAFVFGDAVTDYGLHTAIIEVLEPFSNQSFEEQAESKRPGEAKNWQWESHQQVGLAEFNAQNPLYEQWRTAMEEFGPGWDDLENWINDLENTELISMLFNKGVTLYESFKEEFSLWDIWNGTTFVTGTPWKDDFVFIQPFEDTRGLSGGPTGFDGWWDHLHSLSMSNDLPLEKEEFGEAWNNDPLSTEEAWYPGTLNNGLISGFPIEFPVTIPPDKNLFVIYLIGVGQKSMELTAGDYADAASLAAMIDGKWQIHAPGTGLEFNLWSNNNETGITFGWDGVTITEQGTIFGLKENQPSNDVRSIIGMLGFGPNGKTERIKAKEWMLNGSLGEDKDDVYLLDSWSFIKLSVKTDPNNGTYALGYNLSESIFDTGISEDTVVELFKLPGWFGAGAEWKPELGSVTPAVFESGEDMEEFDESEWPEEIWT